MELLSAILLVALIITLYQCRVWWFEPVSELIDCICGSGEGFMGHSFKSGDRFPAFRGRELGNMGLNWLIASGNNPKSNSAVADYPDLPCVAGV